MIKNGLPPIHPGEFLREILEGLDISQAAKAFHLLGGHLEVADRQLFVLIEPALDERGPVDSGLGQRPSSDEVAPFPRIFAQVEKKILIGVVELDELVILVKKRGPDGRLGKELDGKGKALAGLFRIELEQVASGEGGFGVVNALVFKQFFRDLTCKVK